MYCPTVFVRARYGPFFPSPTGNLPSKLAWSDDKSLEYIGIRLVFERANEN
jgi:hypothetical protein